MAFGEHLQDQLPAINSFTQNGLAFVNEIRDFYKERAVLEKDFAHRLEQLAKRYTRQKEKAGQSLMAEPATKLEETVPSEKRFGTVFKAWETLLAETEEIAKDRIALADKILNEIGDPLKTVATRKEEARKKHMAFAQRLQEERAKAISDKDKMKEKYEQCCDQVEAAKVKQEKAPDEKMQEKLKKIWQAEVMEMNNVKNNYILAVLVANAIQKKYYHVDMPTLMQELNEDRMAWTKKIGEAYLALEVDTVQKTQKHLQTMQVVFQAVTPRTDADLFVTYHKVDNWKAPMDFAFEPSLLWKDTEQLVTDDEARIYLANKLAKLKEKIQEVDVEIRGKGKEVEGLTNLRDAYLRNPATGDSEEVNENIIEANRVLAILHNAKVRYGVAMHAVVQAIGDGDQGKRHTLVKASFTIPTTCDYCQEKIWGLAKQGFTCKDCGYNCHAKCEMKVPPYCSLNKEARLKRATSVRSVSSPTSLAVTPTSASSVDTGAKNPSRSNLAVSAKTPKNVPTATAVYSYDATNGEELTIKEGEAVKVVGQDDGSGWILVESVKKGGKGLVPLSYIQMGGGSSAAVPKSARGKMARVMYDYDATTGNELTIRTGDEVEVTMEGDDGWWEGTLVSTGKRGQFPGSYVERM